MKQDIKKMMIGILSLCRVMLLYIIVAFTITGCGPNNNVEEQNSVNNKVTESSIKPTENIKEKEEGNITNSNEEIDTSISSGYCLSFGVLTKSSYAKRISELLREKI